jgi:hypothetical protein
MRLPVAIASAVALVAGAITASIFAISAPANADLDDYEVVFNSEAVSTSADVAAWAYCPEGKVATGGGTQVPSDSDSGIKWYLTYTRPIIDGGNAIGWIGQAHRTGGTSTTAGGIGTWVICGTVS